MKGSVYKIIFKIYGRKKKKTKSKVNHNRCDYFATWRVYVVELRNVA